MYLDTKIAKNQIVSLEPISFLRAEQLEELNLGIAQ